MLIGVAAVCLVAYTGHQALNARTALQAVASDFETLSTQLTSGDASGARSTLRSAQQHAETAKANTGGPGWWLSSKIPGIGANVTAVRTVSTVVDTLSRDVLPEVVTASETLDPARLRPDKGRIDLAPIQQVAPSVVRANTSLQQQSSTVQAIDTGALAPQIAEPVQTLQTKLASAAALSGRAAKAVQLLPSMLGADGPRTYLLLFQNNAEVRATGGIPGAFATVHADKGRVTIGKQGDAGTIGRFTKPPLPLTAQEKRLYDVKMGLYPQDVNFTPDFPRSAELIKAMWEASGHPHVDGVLSTDPVALSYVLNGTGPVTLADGSKLTAQGAVMQLLNSVYMTIADPAEQNVYFSSVARSVFSSFVAGQGNPGDVLRQLDRAAGERRLLLWSNHPAEQRILEPTALSGSLPTRSDVTPDVGVYLDDGTAAKMDYYLHYLTSVTSDRCQAGRQYLTVTLQMASHAPANAATLPAYVVGRVPGIPRGIIRTNVFLYAPTGGYVTSLRVNDQTQPLEPTTHDGRPVVAQTVDLLPGQSHTLSYQVVSGKGQTGQVALDVTPGANGSGVGTIGPSACS